MAKALKSGGHSTPKSGGGLTEMRRGIGGGLASRHNITELREMKSQANKNGKPASTLERIDAAIGIRQTLFWRNYDGADKTPKDTASAARRSQAKASK